MQNAFKRSVWLSCFCLTILAIGGSSLHAETASERRERLAQEKKQKDDQKAAAKKAADQQKQEKGAMARSMRELATPKTVKLDAYDVQYTTMPYWTAGGFRGSMVGVVDGAGYLDPKAKMQADGGFSMDSIFFIRVLPIEQGKTIDDAVEKCTKELNCCGPHYAAKPEKDITISGEPARSIVLVPNQKGIKGKHYFAAAQHGDKAYIFHLRGTDTSFDAARPSADKMVKSVKWLGAKVPPSHLPATRPAETVAKQDVVAESKQAPAPAPVPATPAAPIKGGDGLD